MLTKNIKTHKIIFKDNRTPIAITQSEYELYESEIGLKKHNEFLKIEDRDTQETLFNGRCSEIKEFEKLKVGANSDYKYICDFGHRHELTDECKHSDTYGCLWFTFHDRLKEMGYDIFYSTDISEQMQREYLTNK